jgi:hypothetical protein
MAVDLMNDLLLVIDDPVFEFLANGFALFAHFDDIIYDAIPH